MADWVSSASSGFLPVVFQIAANFLAEEMRLMRGLPTEIEGLKPTVDLIIKTLNDVATMNPSGPLKRWLDELREVGYEAIDLLDEHNTELLRRDLVHAPELRNKLSIVNPKRIHYRHDMSHKIKEVSLKMSDVFQKRIEFGLDVNQSSPVGVSLEITTSLPPTHIVGRENEKSEILNKLIPYNNAQVGILAIHGMGRFGKTTLAQQICTDDKTLKHFDMTLWVHVSHEFDLEKVTRSILDSMGEQQFRHINLDTVQKLIQKKLEGKRYLLVLDDFWNEKLPEWEKLIRPLHRGAPGSVIIVTTRIKLVSDMVSKFFHSYPLKNLSEHDCFSLVAQYASHNEDVDAFAKLYALSSEIFLKCRGMPEEAIGLGDQLRREHDKEKWDEIIARWGEGHIFSEERNGFINSMRFHYSRFPSNLKPCLAYCSIIPKGLQFEKQWIIQLWMAQNFIPKQSEQRIEDIGNDYFNRLVQWSFFQKTRIGLKEDWYNIPDMVHEVARQTSAGECCIFELGKPHNSTKTTKHMSIVFTREGLSCTHDPFTEIYHCKGLYTLLIVGGSLINHPLQLPGDLFSNLPRLRTLEVSYCNLGPLPTNIGDLKHLRYLQLRDSNIEELPESISELYNLQKLGLRNCFFLRKLPEKTRCLRKLRYLDLHLDYLHPNVDPMVPSYGKLESMPPEIGMLTNLQVLSRFVVSTGRHCGLNELKNLNSLQGELSISNLDLVKNSDDAAKANLHAKSCIKRLEFLWRGDRGLHEYSKEIIIRTESVLDNLKPNGSIKELNIVGYTGGILPPWLGSADYSHLHAISLSDCTNCIVLPSLGNLPMLQDLHIKGMRKVESIGCEDFCGNNFYGNNRICFPSLNKLVLENMENVKQWTGHENCKLSRLSELVLKDCANLQILTHNFPSQTKLTLENIPELTGLHNYPFLKHLKVVACSNWIWGSCDYLSSLLSLTLSQIPSETLPADLPKILNSLRSLEISHCNNLTMLPDDWIPSSITHLCIRQCPMLRELPKGLETLNALEDLEIQDCENLKSLPKLKNLKFLTRLEISGCHSFVFLPSEGLPYALQFLSISDCPSFSKKFEDLQSPDRLKIKHVFSVWIDQKHLDQEHLTSRRITQGESSTWRI